MKQLKYCKVQGGNFGDDINLQLWGRLFPNLEELGDQVLLYGVGTLLDGRHDRFMRKVVLGSGIGEFQATRPDTNWDFRWVRGPMTATEFGLPADCAIGDAAILWPELSPGHDRHGPAGLIPHYATWDTFDWDRVASDAGMIAINPRLSPANVIAGMRGCSRILAESLHGAICADAIGIPWSACILAHRFNAFKWRDWSATIERPFSPLIVDRPLVRQISPLKGFANNVARLVNYKQHTRYPALRPVAPSTPSDASRVSLLLRQYASRAGNFSCSDPRAIARQRQLMARRCADFARDYRLQFMPA
jgi:hypothetical protein